MKLMASYFSESVHSKIVSKKAGISGLFFKSGIVEHEFGGGCEGSS
jgi:hypothetical protein